MSTCTIQKEKQPVSTPDRGMDVVDLFSVNVTQVLEVEAEAEDHQGAGSQPRAWGMVATHMHTLRGFHIPLGINELVSKCLFVCLFFLGQEISVLFGFGF